MFERVSSFFNGEATKKAATSGRSELRAPTSLVVGLLGACAQSEADCGLAAAFGARLQKAALELWPDLLRPDGVVRVEPLRSASDAVDCDVLAFVDGDPLAVIEHLRPRDIAQPCVLLRRDDETCAVPTLFVVARDEDDRLCLVERPHERPFDALATIVFRPPVGGRGAARLRDFLNEGAPRPSSRLEYDLLLRLLGPRDRPVHEPTSDPWAEAARLATDADSARALERLRRAHDYADAHAVYYGNSWRSVVVARSSLLLAPTIVSGAIGIAAPSLSSLTSMVQLVIIFRIFLDRKRAGRERWEEKWLDYRDLAERLRCLRYLLICGAADAASDDAVDPTWVTWFARRLSQDLPRPKLADEASRRPLDYLLNVEIKSQVAYHRGVVRRFCALDLRLRFIARVILIFAASLGCLIFALGLFRHGLYGVPWPELTSLGLSVAPALVANLNGFRGEFDMVRQQERSARAVAGLSRLAREASSKPASVRNLRKAAASAAHLMIGDAMRWRSTLEMRAARLSRR